MSCAEERYKKILDTLKERDYISTNELITILDTSRETVRRDVNLLAKRGAIIKVHGGVSSKESASSYDIPVFLRENTNVDNKKTLCAYSVKYINDKDNIFIDNSSTAAYMINYIPKNYHITLITYSIKLLCELAKIRPNNWNIISLGGNFDFNTLSTTNYLTVNNLSIFKPTKSFISCHGIDENYNVLDSYLNDIEIKRIIIENSQETFLLLDSSKLKRKGVMTLANAKKFHHIITNKDADMEFLENLKSYGCNIELA